MNSAITTGSSSSLPSEAIPPILRKRRTKILATLGPASNTKDEIRTLFEAGANAFRLNFSHGDHDGHRTVLNHIRAIEEEFKRPIAVIGDLQGPKLRIGEFGNGGKVALNRGQNFRFDLDETPGDETRVCLPHPEVISVLEEGRKIFLDDGKVRARIIKKGKDFVETEILSGNALSNRKGLNVPDAIIPLAALTEKDIEDLDAALDMGVDWIAQSFVQTPDDVREAIRRIDGRAAHMVKLEKPSALTQFEEILSLTDGVMLARGDLGVEIPPEDVPAVQKRIVRQVRAAGKPVVVATQMLESMIENARPTRAEASDVATAVYDGADVVMLSAETASGAYPERAVEIMGRICAATEKDELYDQMMDAETFDALPGNPSDAITTAAYYVAQDIEAVVIVTYTMSGSTALRMARQRPEVPILCLTPNLDRARRLALSYGVRPYHAPETVEDFTGPASHAAGILKEQGLGQPGDYFVLTAGIPFAVPGTTNILRIAKIE